MRPQGEGAGVDDPLARVLQLGATDRRRVLAVTLAAALLAHGSMAGAIRLRGEHSAARAGMFVEEPELAIEREVPPPPPPPEPESSPPPPPQPVRLAVNVTVPAPNPSEHPDEAPASEAAQAGEILVQEDDDEEEETDDGDEVTFVTGDAGTYAGGVTASGGTSQVAVRGSVVADGGVPGGGGAAVMAPPPARDLSRDAWLAGNTSWDCDFPGEADRDEIRDAVVEMTVTVRPNGTVESVQIVDDPGHGFARMATACALRHSFAPALDSIGRKIWGTTRPFHVGFHR
jgi:protein TonB